MSADAAARRGLIVSAGSSSDERMMVEPTGARPSPSGHTSPRLVRAAMSRSTVVFPRPPSPAKTVTLPLASQFFQSQSIGLIWTSVMQRMTSPGCRDLSCSIPNASSSLLLRLSMSIMPQPVRHDAHKHPQAQQKTQHQRRCRYPRHQRRSVVSCRDCPRLREVGSTLTGSNFRQQCRLLEQQRCTQSQRERGYRRGVCTAHKFEVGICGQ